MKDMLRKLAFVTIIMLGVLSASGCGIGSGKTSEPSSAGQPENPKTAQERRRLLETVGTLTAANCYQGYLNIGLIADGKAKGIYAAQDASKVLSSVWVLLDSIDHSLADISEFDLDKQDRERLEQMRDLSSLLRLQGQELQAYWDSGNEEDRATYDNTRKDSWAALAKLTGIGR